MMLTAAPCTSGQVTDSSLGISWGMHSEIVEGGYRKITLRLSDEALEGWEDCAAEAAVSLSALTEALGLFLRDQHFSAQQSRVIIESARRIDLERRRRRPVE